MMAYGRNDASDALRSIAGGTASFESRAKLEHHLLRLLRRRGTQGVSAFLRSLPEFEFTCQDTADVSRAARNLTPRR